MKKLSLLASACLAFGMLGTVQAGPLPSPDTAPEVGSLVETVQSWRYRRDCTWVNGGWHYGAPGRHVVCRPHRPSGRGWSWHTEGGRHGWYHSQRRSWHHNKW